MKQHQQNDGFLSVDALIKQFCTQIELSAGASKSAANTAHSYTAALTIFARFIANAYSRKVKVSAPYPVEMLQSDILLAYYDWLNHTTPSKQQQPDQTETAITASPRYAAATIQHYLAAVKRLLAWAVAQDLLPEFDLAQAEVKLKGGRGGAGNAYAHRKIDPNLAAILLHYDEAPMPEEPNPAYGSISNLARYHIRRRQIALLRNRAIVYVLFDTGLRVSELTSLRRDQIDRALKETPLPADIAVEVVGKGGRRRTVWITDESLIRIQKYLEARHDPSNVLFVGGKKGHPITRQMVWKVVSDGAKAAGVGDFTGPHAFRHWLARQLFNDETDPVPMEDVQELLGHASPNTTRTIYAPHSSKSRLHRTIQKARKKPAETLTEHQAQDSGEDNHL